MENESNLPCNPIECTHPKPAAPLRRLFGAGFDLLLILCGSVILLLPSILVFSEAIIDPSPWKTVALYASMFLTGGLVVLLDIAYRVAVPYYLKGATVGQRYFRLRLLDDSGKEASDRQIFIRSFVIVLLSFLTLGLYSIVEIINLCYSESHRDFADIISHTIVVEVPEGDGRNH